MPGLGTGARSIVQFLKVFQAPIWYRSPSQAKFLTDGKTSWSPYYLPTSELIHQNYETFLYSLDSSDVRLKQALEHYNHALETDDFSMGIHGELKNDLDDWEHGKNLTPAQLAFSYTSPLRPWPWDRQQELGDFIAIGQVGLDNRLIDTSFQYSLSFSSCKVYKMFRGNWFDKEMLDIFRHGPFTKGHAAEQFFSENGLLNLIPREALVVYQPTFSIQLSLLKFETFGYHLMNDSVQIGLFRSAKFERVVFDEKHKTATLHYAYREDPILLGMEFEQYL